jgi:hypothetical protein
MKSTVHIQHVGHLGNYIAPWQITYSNGDSSKFRETLHQALEAAVEFQIENDGLKVDRIEISPDTNVRVMCDQLRAMGIEVEFKEDQK